jgi:hypothetical protein
MSDFGRNKLIQTQLGEDTGQYSEKCFGANDKGTFDVLNAEARRPLKLFYECDDKLKVCCIPNMMIHFMRPLRSVL